VTEQEVPPATPPLEELAPHPESMVHAPSLTPESVPEISGLIAGPWLRFFARSVDIFIGSALLAFVVGMFLPTLFEAHGIFTGHLGARLFGAILLPFVMVLDAITYSLFGNTLGKWTAGIKVKTSAGDKVSFPSYLKRNFGMYVFGYGAGIPIVSLVTMGTNYSRAEGRDPARWDESAATRPFVKSISTPRTVVIGAIWLAFFASEIFALISG
jgi:uncharacterized RDD family membrane protein YckC